MNNILNKNHKGDCIKVMKNMPKEKVQLILTDPPYNASKNGVNLPNNKTGGAYYKVNEKWDKFSPKEYLDFTKKWVDEADKRLVPNGSFMVCGSLHNIGEVIIVLKDKGYKFINLITWKKTNPMPNITRRTLTHSTEFIAWFAKGKGWKFNYENMKKYNQGKQLKDVWEFSLCQGAERIKGDNGKSAHPTQKPLELFKRLVEMATDKGDIIMDPFIGSGTTAIAAEMINRMWIGIDNNNKYIKLANKRLKDLRKKNQQ
ncbi:site-specific DNA-methyltransferase [Candidatus Woesearchaeota archaeon]|nr:site-specific DNA-methyltransferase [Candidatus Woesearchaeota archaeon]MBT6519113.1 site-specific DNA-methyltransferase [Candidatus Woesearchaeota archaeon]MBT7366975.1 site-specific DNA-methyltransferase [Candidatus Woesearchaeota archaeon]